MKKSSTVAGLLAFFGGVVGLHKFYLRDFGSGVFYIFLAIMTGQYFFPVTAMLGVLESIALFSMSEEKFDKKYNNPKRQSRRSRRRNSRQQSREQRNLKMERERFKNEKLVSKKRANPFLKSAQKKYKEFDLQGAIEDYNQALEISAGDATIYYDLAGIYSLLENNEKSFHYLSLAASHGFRNKEKIRTADEFAYLRIQDEFDSFMANDFASTTLPKIETRRSDLLQEDALLSQLNRLKELREKGLLTEKEFLYEQKKIRQQR